MILKAAWELQPFESLLCKLQEMYDIFTSSLSDTQFFCPDIES